MSEFNEVFTYLCVLFEGATISVHPLASELCLASVFSDDGLKYLVAAKRSR